MKKEKMPAEDTRAGRFIMGELRLREAFGQDRAVRREEILDALNRSAATFEDQGEPELVNDRTFRAIYRELPICSNKAGLYIPATPADLDAFEAYLRKKALGLFRRIKIVQDKRPDLGPARRQFVLSFDEKANPSDLGFDGSAGPKALPPEAALRPCRTCGGSGKVTGNSEELRCPTCKGSGRGA